MSEGLSQADRSIQISKFGSVEFVPVALAGREEISRPFRFTVDLVSDAEAIDVKDVLGKSATVTLGPFGDNADSVRHFNGIVWQFSAGAFASFEDAAIRNYQAELVPWTYMLKLNKDCRIFQEKTTPQIVEQVLKDRGFTDYKLSLQGTYAKQDYRVQYNETDYDFVSRLMEEVGIFYFFTHEEAKHSLVLADTASAYKTCGISKVELHGGDDKTVDVLTSWRHNHVCITPGNYTLRSYDFESPKTEVLAKEKTKLKVNPGKNGEQYEYSVEFSKATDGKALAVSRMEAREALFETAYGTGYNPTFAAGTKFKLTSHPDRDEVNTEYALTAVEHEISEPLMSASGGSIGGAVDDRPLYWNQFECIPSRVPFRPHRTTPRPTVSGPQTAIVVGARGQEMLTDKYGRIRVQFHWDREGKLDDKSSCWIRVAQSWAGPKFGAQFLPRIGSEVLVEYVNGDIDHPIVTGSVYNGTNMPIYNLPDDELKSGIKTISSDKAKTKNFNELRFYDKIGKEEIYFHAERDFNRVVENNDTLKVGFDAKDKGDQTIDIFNNRTVTIDKGEDKLTLKTGGRTVQIDKGDDSLTLKQGNLKIGVKAGQATIEAAKAILLKVGGSMVKIDMQGVTVKGPQVKIAGDVKVDIKGAMTSVTGAGMLTLKGGLVKIN